MILGMLSGPAKDDNLPIKTPSDTLTSFKIQKYYPISNRV